MKLVNEDLFTTRKFILIVTQKLISNQRISKPLTRNVQAHCLSQLFQIRSIGSNPQSKQFLPYSR